MKFHPISNIFPLMSEKEISDLAEDIAKNGLHEPIVVFENKILDGRNRFLACQKVKVSPGFEDYKGSDPLSFVISLNLKRRHLNESQRGIVAAKLANMQAGGDRPSEKDSNFDSANLRIGKVSQPEASRLLNVSSRTIQDAKFIMREAPEKVEAIERGERTIHQVKREIKREEAQRSLEEKSLEMPKDKFQVLCADPPWKYDFSETESRAIENQYPTMSLEEICLLQVPAAEDSVLFLWATAPKLKEALKVLEGWGFKYVTDAVWDKGKIGMGYWFRGQHELLLVGVKGKFSPPAEQVRVSSVFRFPRQEHSEKPDGVYDAIKTMFPKSSRIELFARNKREGWKAWPKRNKDS